ncbi:DNA internalization-related competence protein ComEC/Rec2 [Aeromonas bivalvium]|uniref:DNA internalization-related competence protein ComEC/Rec2 n=1 Tax=Aeromonas bivalvium TaxID=440079 RepID=UPI0038D06071
MDLRLLSFALGASSCLLWPWLPSFQWGGLWLSLLIPFCYMRAWRLLFLVLGILWMQLNMQARLSWLDALGEQASHIITAQLQSAEPQDDKFTRLRLKIITLNGASLPLSPLVRINAYQTLPALTAGSTLTLVTSLKPAHGLANEAGMDGRRQLLGKGISATGNLRRIIEVAPAPPGLRARWLTRAGEAWQGLTQAPLLAALTFGEQGGITDRQWDLFRGAGLSHIIAISGQHIALVAVLGWWLGRLAGQRGALLVSLLFAATYSWLAGFAVATERALIMVLIWSLLRLWRRDWPPYRVWLLAFVAIVLWDPFALFAAGFWLSFLAVALLMGASYLYGRPSLLRLQGILLLGLLPLQLALFEGVAPLALLINLLALPLFCLFIIPLALLGVLASLFSLPLGHGLFWLADGALGQLLGALAWLDSQWSLWWPLPGWALPASALLLLIWLAWRLPAGRWLGLPLLAVALLACWPAPPRWQVRVLDVGQGLAVLVTRGERALLYDTGDRYPGGYNMADAVILPLLRRLAIAELDMLILSHRDRDHAGNREALLAALPTAREISSYPFSPSTQLCRRGQTWQWQDLSLRMLWPEHSGGGRNNDGCVLHISDGRVSVLLAADIEKEAEARLLALEGEGLRSTLLISPHHGSKTSSTPGFVAAVAPMGVVHSAGFLNRWGFPRPEVVARYDQMPSAPSQWQTGVSGAIRFDVGSNGFVVRAEREAGPWYRRAGAWWKPQLWLE